MVSERALLARWRDALRDSELDTTAKCVGFVICTYWDGSGRGAFPSKRTIAAGAGIGKRTADHRIAALERAGFLTINRSRGRQRNTYSATVPTVQPGDTVNGAASLHGSALSTVQNDEPNRAQTGPQRCSSSAPESVESEKENAYTARTRAGKQKRAADARDYSEYTRA